MADRYRFYRSRDAKKATAPPYFFYHLPKCGGMSFHSAAELCWAAQGKIGGQDAPLVARADRPADLAGLGACSCALISTHLPFGAHASVFGARQLITFLRDAAERVRSSFTYRNMRERIVRPAEDFIEFYRLEPNRNIMTKSLAGIGADEPVDQSLFEKARRNLAGQFSIFADCERIDDFIEGYIRLCGLPNLIAPQINITDRSYLIDSQPYRHELCEMNEYDCKLHEFAKEHERFLGISDDDGTAHEMTILSFQEQGANQVFMQSVFLQTRQLKESSILSEDGSLNGQELDRLIRFLRENIDLPSSLAG